MLSTPKLAYIDYHKSFGKIFLFSVNFLMVSANLKNLGENFLKTQSEKNLNKSSFKLFLTIKILQYCGVIISFTKYTHFNDFYGKCYNLIYLTYPFQEIFMVNVSMLTSVKMQTFWLCQHLSITNWKNEVFEVIKFRIRRHTS